MCNTMLRIGRRGALLGLLATCLAVTTGCHAIAFTTLMWGEEPTKKVPADYPYLSGEKICILVRAEMETLFEYPHVQWEVADHIRVALEANVRGLTVVNPRTVTDYQRQNARWDREDPAAIGRRFNADRILDINLTQYTTREPESPHLYRGYIAGVVSVYDVDYPDSQPTYTTDVQTVYPENSPGQWGISERDIRMATMEAFAQDVAGKFYERTVKVK